ncbi:hypothetical protein [Cytobacillus gottheilii]|uniref:hypothetical protein n=1 Tax=Cytobacillus gottheilii TaxID=859144 RepID=UPI002494F26F|nr:hypothetical protein [Cytobacillus gottheilii]
MVVKIRLHGEPEDVERVLNLIKDSDPFLKVLSESSEYKDRGKSEYIRKYIEVKTD